MKGIEAQLKRQSNAHWMAVFEAAGVPCGQVNYRADIYDDPQANALDMIWELENEELGSYRTSGNPIRFLKTPLKPGKGAPTLGQHSDAILKEFGYSNEQIAELRAQGAVV